MAIDRGGVVAASLSQVTDRCVPRTVAEKPIAHAVSLAGSLLAPVAVFFCILSGYILLNQEWGGNGVLIDGDAVRMGEWMKANTAPGSVVMHSNYHVQPSGAIAGRPSLVAYYGWVSNHGYNCHERLRDRDYVMDNALKDEDEQAYFLARRWGVRYILGENIRRHDRPSEAAFRAAQQRIAAGEQGVAMPRFEPDVYLSGKLRRVHTEGRYELFEVTGY